MHNQENNKLLHLISLSMHSVYICPRHWIPTTLKLKNTYWFLGLMSKAALHQKPAQNYINRKNKTKGLQTPRTVWILPYSNFVIHVYIFHTELLALFEVQFTFWQLQLSGQCNRPREAERVRAISQSLGYLKKSVVRTYRLLILSHVFHPVRIKDFHYFSHGSHFNFSDFFHSHCRDRRADCSIGKCTWSKMSFFWTKSALWRKKLNASALPISA